jgi:hypothetical protein
MPDVRPEHTAWTETAQIVAAVPAAVGRPLQKAVDA